MNFSNEIETYTFPLYLEKNTSFPIYLVAGSKEKYDKKMRLRHDLKNVIYLFLTIFSLFRYLSCVSQTMKKLQPFGDVPRKLTEQLRRSFVASRTFAQALLEGKQIINKISKVRQRVVYVVYGHIIKNHAIASDVSRYVHISLFDNAPI